MNVRTSLNQMFNDLYGALSFPTKLEGISANTTWIVPPNSKIIGIDLSATSGNPTVSIGTTPAGSDIVASVQPGTYSPNPQELYFATATTIYITVSGGTLNIRINLFSNYF